MATSPSRAKYQYYQKSGMSYNMDFFDAIKCIHVVRCRDEEAIEELNQKVIHLGSQYGQQFSLNQQVSASGTAGWIIGVDNCYYEIGHGDQQVFLHHPGDIT